MKESFIHSSYIFSLFSFRKAQIKSEGKCTDLCWDLQWRISQTAVRTAVRTLSSLQNKVHHEWTATVIAFVCACVCLASGWMYHIAEQYSGRNSWDSFPASGPNRAPWAPGSNWHWAPPSRSSILHTHLEHCFIVRILLLLNQLFCFQEQWRELSIPKLHSRKKLPK